MSRLRPQQRKAVLSVLASLTVLQLPSVSNSMSDLLINKKLSLAQLPAAHQSTPPLLTTSSLSAAMTVTQDGCKPHPEQAGYRISQEYLDTLSEAECIWRFRFTASELLRLAEVLEIPDPLITANGHHANAVECIGLLCARLRSPEDQWSLATKYARPQSSISEITNETAEWINERWSFLLGWDGAGLVHPDRLRVYADALHAFGAPSHSLFGFIDCTIRPTCRPGIFQRVAYTGYKKCHGMKYQGIVTPNGLMAHLDGPYLAPQNDLAVLALSGVCETLREQAIQPGSVEGDPPDRRYFQVYGDSAYGVSEVMVSPFSGVREVTAEEAEWNTAMGGLRISVEHGFGLVVQDWPFLNCQAKQKILGTRCGLLYRVAVLLTNAHACLVPNQTSLRYNVPPPSLEEYFHL